MQEVGWLVAWEKKGGSDGQVGERKEKKRKGKWVVALGFSLGQKMEVGSGPRWVRIGPGLKEMGLGRRKWA